ncbi:MAG TPA: DNA-formamidopyrimidine glycosylase family protein [Pyrinomonadaceae bacterium]
MPEGPEVRKYADALSAVLKNRRLEQLTARTVKAKAWLKDNGPRLSGLRVTRVFARGKHLVGLIENNFYFHSHLMMWGRWQTFVPTPPAEMDRRERARIVVNGGAAILYSAPIFNVGEGDPFKQIEHLGNLGPDVLPYDNQFDQEEFQRRLLSRKNRDATIGAALLNQEIVAGLGNYLRAEILFACRIDPWKPAKELDERELDCLLRTAPQLSRRSYLAGATARRPDRERMKNDASLVYQVGREYGTRHMVFRRTNLPCLRCGEPIRQQRQITHSYGDEERDRIVYFCPRCQKVDLLAKTLLNHKDTEARNKTK